MMKRVPLLLAVLAPLAASAPAPADPPRLADYYGFRPLEIYKLDDRIGRPLIADFDGDKAGDLLIVNNGRSRIDFLLTTKPAMGQETRFRKSVVNELPDDSRMRLSSLPVNKAVVSVQVADFNGDGKPDIAYYGTPAELIILANQGEAKFDELKRVDCGEAVQSGSALAVGDLDRDGKADLALLRDKEVAVLYQREGGKFEDLVKYPHTSQNPRILKLADIDGDGGKDIVILGENPDAPFRVRFSTPNGKLGPEQRLTIDKIDALEFADLDGKPGDELLVVASQSNRVGVYSLQPADLTDAESHGQLIFYPLPEGNGRDRSMDLGDIDGDGRIDAVVADTPNSQFLVYRQAGGLGTAASFPGLIGAKTVKLADIDGDKSAEVLVLSPSEKQIGLSRWKENRLTFPEPLRLEGEPIALEVADIDGDGKPEILYLSKAGDAVSLRGLKHGDGGMTEFLWGQESHVPVKGFSGTPKAMRVRDVNRDGKPDVMIFAENGGLTLLLGRDGGVPTPGPAGPLAKADDASVSFAELGGGAPSILFAQGTVGRELVLEGDEWKVVDQFNAGRPGAQVQGVAALDIDQDGKKDVVLFDKATKKLLILANRDGVYRSIGAVDLGTIDFTGMRVADLDGDGDEDLLVQGTDKYAVLVVGRRSLKFQSVAGFESNRKEAHFSDVGVGDLNGDGVPDVLITDTAEHFIEIAAFDRRKELIPALAFPVFEQKSFRDVDNLIEPREFAIGDVDGDGRQDLVLIVHDRVLIYRQDSGEGDAAGAPKAQ